MRKIHITDERLAKLDRGAIEINLIATGAWRCFHQFSHGFVVHGAPVHRSHSLVAELLEAALVGLRHQNRLS